MTKPLVLFDGYCALCNASVAFLQARQRSGELEYASLQSARGLALLKEVGLSGDKFDTLVFYENGRPYLRSTAALKLVRYLRFPWPLLYILTAIPPFVRDPVYNLIAHNRYRWFGRSSRE
jgi:predicted DCC family thiol-disulfide oxidoreductase YuxK